MVNRNVTVTVTELRGEGGGRDSLTRHSTRSRDILLYRRCTDRRRTEKGVPFVIGPNFVVSYL